MRGSRIFNHGSGDGHDNVCVCVCVLSRSFTEGLRSFLGEVIGPIGQITSLGCLYQYLELHQ